MNEEIKFDAFLKYFSDQKLRDVSTKVFNTNVDPIVNIGHQLGGSSYNNGLFIIYTENESIIHTKMVESAFPQIKGKIHCFGRDWLNRQFVLFNEDDQILQIDLGFDEILDIPMNLKSFFESGLIEDKEDILAESFFNDWKKHSGYELKCGESVFYTLLPILGGEDNLTNLEVVDADWNFEFNTKLVIETRALNQSEKIGEITIQDTNKQPWWKFNLR
jgi:hypothetical protein